MLTDNDIKKISDDSLSYNALSETLKEIITSSETPLTIGLYGMWGSGKTSLMQMTRDLLKNNDNFKTVWFDAWKFDKSQDLRVALIHSILREISKDRNIDPILKDKVVDLLKRINWLGLGMTAINQFLPRSLNFKELTDPLLRNKDENPRRTLDLIGDFEDEFTKITKDYAGDDGKLVVFIDDLDRCIPEKAVDILEAIKLFLNVQQSLFIIGADKKVIELGIHEKYPQMFEDWGKNYLDKIVQIPFFLPPVREEIILEKFIPGLEISSDIMEYKSIIAEVGGNPRTIKRLLNQFELQKILAEKQELEVDNGIMAKLAVVHFRQPEFHDNLVKMYVESGINLVQKVRDISESSEAEMNRQLLEWKLEKVFEDKKFIDFLLKEPILENINLDNYIYLVKSTIEVIDNTLDYSGIANSFLREGNHIKAIENYDKALKLDPNNSQLLDKKSYSLIKLNRIDEAMECTKKALEIDQFNPSYLARKANILNMLGRYNDAIITCDKALRIDPNSDEVRHIKNLARLQIHNSNS
jgi:tetratricopeptide (TPR) repeat protein